MTADHAVNIVARSAAALHRVLLSAASLLLLTGPLVAGVVVYAAGWTVWNWLWVWPAVIASSWICAWFSQAVGALAIRCTPAGAEWVERLRESRARAARLTPRLTPAPPTRRPPTTS